MELLSSGHKLFGFGFMYIIKRFYEKYFDLDIFGIFFNNGVWGEFKFGREWWFSFSDTLFCQREKRVMAKKANGSAPSLIRCSNSSMDEPFSLLSLPWYIK